MSLRAPLLSNAPASPLIMGREREAAVLLNSDSSTYEMANARWPDQLRPRTGLFSWFSRLSSKRISISITALILFLTTAGVLHHHSTNARPMTLDIVVSMYNENETVVAQFLHGIKALRAIRDLDTRIIIYSKDEYADAANIQQVLFADRIEVIPNRGREGGTFLHHIVNSWDKFADHTLFMQAWVHVFDYVQHRIEEYFVPETGVLPLGATLELCNSTKCQDPWTNARTFPRLPEIWAAKNRELSPEYLLMGYGGQMIVSKKRIKKTDRKIYQHLKDILESDLDHWIHRDPRQDDIFNDEVTEPYFGHTIERSWMTLFGCSEPRLAETCHSISDHRFVGDPPEKCQCLDTVR